LNPPPKVAAVPKPEPTVPPKNIVPISDAEAEKIIKKFKRKKKSGKGPLILLIILLIAVLGAASVFTVLALLDNKDDKSKVEEKEPVDEIIDITEAEETEPSVIIPKDSETQDDEEKDNEAFVIPCSDGTSAHIPQEEWVVMNEPTYLEEGRRVKLCSQCDKIAVDEPIPVLEYEGFSDVPKDAWYATAVEHCVVQGYFSGYSDGSFKPDDVLTREAFATILARASGAELDSYTDVIFEDVKSGDWFMSSVLWAADMGYMTGVGDGTSFGVGKAVNRQEIAVIFHRYAVSVGVTVEKDINLEDYSDHESIADWAKDSVSWAISYGLLGSTSTDIPTFSPEKTVTRAQAAQIFKNFNNFTVTKKTEEITEENTEE